MHNYKVGDKVLVLPIDGDPHDYSYVYLTEMEESCAGKIMTISSINTDFCNEREKQRKYYNGDSNCYFLKEDEECCLWHSSMFRLALNLPFINLRYYI